LELAFYDERDASRFSELTSQISSPFRGPVKNLVEEAKEGKVDEIYIALPLVALERIRHFLAIMSDTTVDTYIVPDFYSYSTHMSQLRSLPNLQTISIFSSPFEGVGSFIKRTEDLVLGSIIMVLISLVMLVISIGIKLTSRGPVFFKQDRYGLSGQKIKVWKFRTMRVMENSDTVKQATKGDPRVTRFGAFLRRTSLDELPQFFNVLQGSMSIVGPRPHAVIHNEQFRKQVENYMIRHKVKPGITGLAQVNGYRGEIDVLYKMEKRVQYDIEYIQNWSLWLDIKIIIKTIFKGFVGKNAY
jgi:putative colanic acid biosynthesis UDP-glucose lipid carrier transferase